jgi:hypothetical protein
VRLLRHPTTKWAQRKDRVFVELHLMDIANEKVELTATHLKFQGESGQKTYAFELELFDEVDTADSKWSKTGFHMLFVLEKKNANAAFWPRLVKSKEKNQYIQVDWAKWVDEDEEEEDPNKGLGGFDPSQMQSTHRSIQTSVALAEPPRTRTTKKATSTTSKRRRNSKAKTKPEFDGFMSFHT